MEINLLEFKSLVKKIGYIAAGEHAARVVVVLLSDEVIVWTYRLSSEARSDVNRFPSSVRMNRYETERLFSEFVEKQRSLKEEKRQKINLWTRRFWNKSNQREKEYVYLDCHMILSSVSLLLRN